MILEVAEPLRSSELAFRVWSEAEILDTPTTVGLTLRALVCRLTPGQWQWSVSSINHDHGELISIGVERSAAAARQTATDEITKCLDSPID